MKFIYDMSNCPFGDQSYCKFVYCTFMLVEGNCMTLSKGGEGRDF